jgi:hypothetical protein
MLERVKKIDNPFKHKEKKKDKGENKLVLKVLVIFLQANE